MKISKIKFTGININLTWKKCIWRKAESKLVHTKIRWEAQRSLLRLWVFKIIVFTWLISLIKKNTIFLLEVTVLTEFTFREYVWKIRIWIIMAFQVAFQVKTMFHENEESQFNLCQRSMKVAFSTSALYVLPISSDYRSKDLRKAASGPALKGLLGDTGVDFH